KAQHRVAIREWASVRDGTKDEAAGWVGRARCAGRQVRLRRWASFEESLWGDAERPADPRRFWAGLAVKALGDVGRNVGFAGDARRLGLASPFGLAPSG